MRHQVLLGAPAPLTVVTDEVGTVRAAGFGDPSTVLLLLPADVGSVTPVQDPAVACAWQRYLDGDVAALNDVSVQQRASPVQAQVWDALRSIPPGEPVSYSEMAVLIGRPRAARAVGAACGANRIAPFIPCHRVVAAGGSLGGYGYGLHLKRWLLDHEAAGLTL